MKYLFILFSLFSIHLIGQNQPNLDQLEMLSKMKPNDPDIIMLIAYHHINNQNFKEAINTCTQLYYINNLSRKDITVASRLRGNAYFLSNNIDSAKLHFDSISRIDKDFDKNMQIGDLYFKTKKYQDAISSYKKVDTNSLNYTYSLIGIAKCNFEIKDISKAKKALQQIIKQFPKNIPAFYELAKINITEKQNEQACKNMNHAINNYTEKEVDFGHIYWEGYIKEVKESKEKSCN